MSDVVEYLLSHAEQRLCNRFGVGFAREGEDFDVRVLILNLLVRP